MLARHLKHFNPTVTLVSGGLVLLFVVLGALFGGNWTENDWWQVRHAITDWLGWLYIVSVGFFLLFVLYLWVSPFGRIKLGRDDDEPEFTNLTWFAMLFSAGMGIGLLFWSVAEPIAHFTAPPGGMEGESETAARHAMTLTFFHWGLHAWAIYIVVGLALSYFAFRHGLPLTIRSTLYPLLGKHIHGPIGYAVEILAIFGTIFGVATSLGLGVQQIGGGLAYLGVAENTPGLQVVLIAIITAIATISVVSGLKVGIRRLSEANLVLGLLLLLFVLIAGPTIFLLSMLIQSIGHYVSSLATLTFRTEAVLSIMPGQEDEPTWGQWWTMFYWAWWISWAPFVGMFIARISRGRTIRQFITGVLLVPTILTFIWLVVFGGSAIYMEMTQPDGAGIITASGEGPELALFALLGNLPWDTVTAIVAMIVIATYFVTSSDSASLVVDILATDGNPNPPMAGRIFWAVTEGAVAAVLLLTGGLIALQTGAIATAIPFTLIMLLICWSLVKGLRAERKASLVGATFTASPRTTLEAQRLDPIVVDTSDLEAEGEAAAESVPDDWRPFLQRMLGPKAEATATLTPEVQQAQQRMAEFVEKTVLPAFKTLRNELQQHGRQIEIDRLPYHVALRVLRDGDEEFFYAIRCRAYRRRVLTFPELSDGTGKPIVRGEVVLRGGMGANRPMSEWSREIIIRDFLNEYSKWMGW
ncbi:BCCT family transporter [Phycisphaerales bacterium AB-hyl4]|uniref:BCCT family transporter n=1 Tax=Natronomicrosphaera hydrolytica TaxID=3242702 RepID=A0ABV4U2T2_9BACT